MKRNDELKEIDIENRKCYYFDNIIKIEDFDLNNILIDEKSYKHILAYNISYYVLNPIKQMDLLALFGREKYNSIYNRIRYLISVKGGVTYIISRNYPKIKVDSCNSLPQ